MAHKKKSSSISSRKGVVFKTEIISQVWWLTEEAGSGTSAMSQFKASRLPNKTLSLRQSFSTLLRRKRWQKVWIGEVLVLWFVFSSLFFC